MDSDDAQESFFFKLGVSVLCLAYDKDYPAPEGDRGRSCAQPEAVGSQASESGVRHMHAEVR